MTAGRITDALLFAFAFALPLSTAALEITLIAALVAWMATRPWRRPWPRGLVVLGWASLALLLGTIAKVFLHDLGELEDLYRVASLVGLAVSLFVVSLAYQRFVFRTPAGGEPAS